MHVAQNTYQRFNLPKRQGDACICVAIHAADRKTSRQLARARCCAFAKERDVFLYCFVAVLVIIVIESFDSCKTNVSVQARRQERVLIAQQTRDYCAIRRGRCHKKNAEGENALFWTTMPGLKLGV